MIATTDFAVERLSRPSAANNDGHRIAIVDGESSVTFDELDRSIDQVANGLLALGLNTGDRVAFVGRSCLACVELMLGAARAGVVVTNVNWRLHPRELSFVLGDSNPRVVVTTAEFAATVAPLPNTAADPATSARCPSASNAAAKAGPAKTSGASTSQSRPPFRERHTPLSVASNR